MPYASDGTASQLRLFEGGELCFDSAFRTAHRHHLDAMSWVDHVSCWLSRNEVLFDAIAKAAGWCYEPLSSPRMTG